MKKLIFILIGLSIHLVLSNTVNANSSTYYADLVADFHIINRQSTAEGYKLNNNITRAELAKIATNLGGYSVLKCTGNMYSDVKVSLGDLCGYIETLASLKIVSTTNKYFRPNDTITRAEAIKILLGVIGEGKSTVGAGYLDTSNLGDLEGYINKAKEIGSIADVSYIFPNSSILRHEVFVLTAFYAGIDTSTPAFIASGGNIPLSKVLFGETTKKNSNSSTTTKQTVGKLNIKESSIQKISEEFDFKVYEAEITAVDGNVVLEQIDLVQFGTGEGINIGELYKLDYENTIFKLTTSKNERIFKYYKRDGNPGISFDLFTGLNPGMEIQNGESVKFTIKIDTNSIPNFSQGKDFQRTNIFYAKYKIKGKDGYYDQSISRGVFYNNPEESYYISGNTPQIIVYNICDEGVKVSSENTPIVFNEYFQRELFSTGRISDRSLDRLAMPIQNYYMKNLGSDFFAYQNDIKEKFIISSATFGAWLKGKYIGSLVEAYEKKENPWVFYGYRSKINAQFIPSNGMQCKDIADVAKMERISFKTTYEEIKASEYQKKVDQLSERVSELEALNAGCTIKGNVNFDTGEKIYHIPGSRFYAETLINTLYGERWFCSESDAVKAGWHKEQGY